MWKDSLPLATIEVKLSSAPVLTALSAVGKFAGVDKASECLFFCSIGSKFMNFFHV